MLIVATLIVALLYHTKKNQPHHRKSPRRYLVRRVPSQYVLSIPYFSFHCKETSPDRFSAGLVFCIAVHFQTSC